MIERVKRYFEITTKGTIDRTSPKQTQVQAGGEESHVTSEHSNSNSNSKESIALNLSQQTATNLSLPNRDALAPKDYSNNNTKRQSTESVLSSHSQPQHQTTRSHSSEKSDSKPASHTEEDTHPLTHSRSRSFTSTLINLARSMSSQHLASPNPNLNVSDERRASIDVTHTFPSSFEDYDMIESLGVGANGSEVWLAKCKSILDKQIAIKVIDLEKYNVSIEEIRKEISTLRYLNHKSVIKYHTSFVHETNVYLVMDYMDGGSVAEIMKTAAPNGFKDEKLIAAILKKALKGLNYLHEKDQMHRDIKGGNILLNSSGTACLSDFGFAAWFVENGDRRKSRQTLVGSLCWMAPEVMEQHTGYDNKADIWSLGITALELANGAPPYINFPPMKTIIMTMNNDPPTLESNQNPNNPTKWSKNFKDFVDKCLQKDPSKRWPAAKLLKHPFLKVSKASQYIQTHLMAHLPSHSERKKMRQANEIKEIPTPELQEDNDNDEDAPKRKPHSIGWDFSTDDKPTPQPTSQDSNLHTNLNTDTVEKPVLQQGHSQLNNNT